MNEEGIDDALRDALARIVSENMGQSARAAGILADALCRPPHRCVCRFEDEFGFVEYHRIGTVDVDGGTFVLVMC